LLVLDTRRVPHLFVLDCTPAPFLLFYLIVLDTRRVPHLFVLDCTLLYKCSATHTLKKIEGSVPLSIRHTHTHPSIHIQAYTSKPILPRMNNLCARIFFTDRVLSPFSLAPPQPLRRSKRIASKPLVQYATDQDFIVDTIEAYCNKKKYNYDEVLVEDFNHWFSTECTLPLNLYEWSGPADIRNIVIDWLQYDSAYIKRERLFKKLHTSLIKYCHANDIIYHECMDIVLLTWIDDQKAKGTIDGEYSPSYYIKKWLPVQKYFH
jgi:hypothetical protein